MKSLAFALLFLFAALPAAGAINALPAPVVVVYPFAITGANADPEAGGRLAVLLASRMAGEGGIDVKPGTPGTDRAHYLQDSRMLGADYYVTGYITPLGDEVSLVDQVVSTYSGIVVWSDTTQIKTYAEAMGQADLMREAMLKHQGRTLAALESPAPAPSSTPQPAQGGQQNLNKLLSRKQKPTPAPKSTPAPAAATTGTQTVAAATPAPAVVAVPLSAMAAATRAPAPPPPPAPAVPSALVVAVGGDAGAQDRTYASTSLSSLVARSGQGGKLVSTASASDLPGQAKQLCAQNAVAAIYAGTLSVARVGSGFSRGAQATVDVTRYDCSGAVTGRGHAQTTATGRSDTTSAIDHSVAQALGDAMHAKG
jgi:hypothetical protein